MISNVLTLKKVTGWFQGKVVKDSKVREDLDACQGGKVLIPQLI